MDSNAERLLVGYTVRRVMRVTVNYSDGVARENVGLYLTKDGCPSSAVWFMDADNHGLPGHADVQQMSDAKEKR